MQWHHVPYPCTQQCTADGSDPADLSLQVVDLVDSHDGDGFLLAIFLHVGHCGPEEDLVTAVVDAGVGDFGLFESTGQKSDASVDFSQALLAIEIVAVLGTVAIGGSPVHDVHDARTLVVDELHELGTQARIALGSHVVAGSGRQGRQASAFVVLIVLAI